MKNRQYRKSKYLSEILKNEYFIESMDSYLESIKNRLINTDPSQIDEREHEYTLYKSADGFMCHLQGIANEHLLEDKQNEQQ